MPLTPDYSKSVKTQTFSGVAKGTFYIPLQMDNNYIRGGYLLTSELLFGEPGFKFTMVAGYAQRDFMHRRLIFDVENSRLRYIEPDDEEGADGADLHDIVAHCTFIRW
ncbi:MAG: hypothetical protein Q7U75_19415 [Desulfobacterales bacterium]|nr:hypothetical protein [Desulfobacterales bacterium]